MSGRKRTKRPAARNTRAAGAPPRADGAVPPPAVPPTPAAPAPPTLAAPARPAEPSAPTAERLRRYESSKEPLAGAPARGLVLSRTDGTREIIKARRVAQPVKNVPPPIPAVNIKRTIVRGDAPGPAKRHAGESGVALSGGAASEAADVEQDEDDGEGGEGGEGGDDEEEAEEAEEAEEEGDDDDDALALEPLASALHPALAAAHNVINSAQSARRVPRPRFRRESKFAQALQRTNRTLATTTVASFSMLRADVGAMQSGGADAASAADAAGGEQARGGGTGVDLTRGDARPSEEEINEFYSALVTNEPYWIRKANAEDACINAPMPSMPAYDAEYLRRYRREPYGGRRACLRAAAERCVGQFMVPHPDGPFAYMEFLTREEDDLFERTGEQPEATRLCEMCIRHYVSYRWKRTHLENHHARVTINPHTHVVDAPGGYRKEACIQQVPGFSDGIVGTFRRFDVSEYVPVVETVRVRDPRAPGGYTEVRVRGHDEDAATFF